MQGNTTSPDGTVLRYDFWDAPSRGVVLVVPGFWRDRRHKALTSLAQRLQQRGLRCAVMDSRGHGESGGTFGFNRHEHEDVAAVIRALLAGQPDITSVTLLGFSYGGAISVSTAARHPELPIGALLLISPVADPDLIRPRLNPFTMHRHIAFAQALRRPRFDWRLRRRDGLRAVDDMPRVHVPVCLIHVKNDWLIGHRHSQALYEAANEPRELHILDIGGNYHADRILSVAADQVDPLVDAFLERHTPR